MNEKYQDGMSALEEWSDALKQLFSVPLVGNL